MDESESRLVKHTGVQKKSCALDFTLVQNDSLSFEGLDACALDDL